MKNFRYVEDIKIPLTKEMENDMLMVGTKLFDLEIELLTNETDIENGRVRVIMYLDNDVYYINTIYYLKNIGLCLNCIDVVGKQFEDMSNIVNDIILAKNEDLMNKGYSIAY